MSVAGGAVLVTGGSRGIGRAIATRLVADGATRVALGYMRNDRAAEETGEERERRGGAGDAGEQSEEAAPGGAQHGSPLGIDEQRPRRS